MQEIYQRKADESIDDYIYRMCSIREELRLTWQEIADIINTECDLNYSESKYRKNWAAYLRGYNDRDREDVLPADIQEAIDAKIELEKERVKLRDERTQANAYIRRLAREETIKEIASSVAEKMNAIKMLPPVKEGVFSVTEGTKEAILEISDWHYGIECSNYWNTYNPEIAKERISRLRDKVLKYCLANEVKRIHVVNLSDLIAGRIHLSIRLESRFDVVTQVIEVSEILAEFLHTLAKHLDVHYYDCLDNHSRIEPNKKDSLDLESLARIIPWYLQTRIGNQVTIHDNEFGPDIITFQSMGYNILGVHGDKDKPNTIVDSLSRMTHAHYDLVLTAHLHHFSADEKNETVVISNGALLGTDTYAKNLRLSSRPTQNLIIVSEDSPCEIIYRIMVDH